MIILRRLLWKAASIAATDTRVQAKAKKIYRTEVAPRAKPAIDALRTDLADAARAAHPVRDPVNFARRAGSNLKRRVRRPEDDTGTDT